jgi:hypothetical protein
VLVAQVITRHLKHPSAQVRSIATLLQMPVKPEKRLLHSVIGIGCEGPAADQIAAQGIAQLVEPAKGFVAYIVRGRWLRARCSLSDH